MEARLAKKRKGSGPALKSTLFQGCVICFWDSSHHKCMLQRVQEHCGSVEESISAATTHVVCKPNFPVQAVVEKLQTCPEGRQCKELAVGSGAAVQVPLGLSIVTEQWVSRSILANARQSEAEYLPPSLQPESGSETQARCHEDANTRQAGVAQHQPRRQQGGALEPIGHGSKGRRGGGTADSDRTGPVPAQQLSGIMRDVSNHAEHMLPLHTVAEPQPACHGGIVLGSAPALDSAAGCGGQTHGSADNKCHGVAAGAAALPGFVETAAGAIEAAGSGALGAAQSRSDSWRQCVVVRQGSDFVCVRGTKPEATGGHTGIPWGFAGVWEEPCDEAAARETVEKVRSLWYRSTRTFPPQEADPAPANANKVCSHPACATRPWCIVQGLDQHRQTYQGAGDKQAHFKMKQLDQAVQLLAQLSQPLKTLSDVDALELGEKTAAKVREVLVSGTTSAWDTFKHSDKRKTLCMFQEVWGAGEEVAARWYREGCRTLEDVRRRTDLTEMQQVGLKYYEDLKHKIPRQEVAGVVDTCRRAIFEVAEAWGARDVERTFAAAAGSYRRGKPESGDIDILACLPPSLQGRDCGLFLTELLAKLLTQEGLLTEDMDPRSPFEPSRVKAMWMGICRPPGAPHYRRIDIKVYAASMAPYALSYFGSSQNFCRAARHWANVRAGELARQHHPSATGFKLNDTGLVPRRKQGWGSEKQEVLVGPEVVCRCETDIYVAIGLAYVPSTMRFFRNFV